MSVAKRVSEEISSNLGEEVSLINLPKPCGTREKEMECSTLFYASTLTPGGQNEDLHVCLERTQLLLGLPLLLHLPILR